MTDAGLFAFLTHLQTGGRAINSEMFIYSEKTLFRHPFTASVNKCLGLLGCLHFYKVQLGPVVM